MRRPLPDNFLKIDIRDPFQKPNGWAAWGLVGYFSTFVMVAVTTSLLAGDLESFTFAAQGMLELEDSCHTYIPTSNICIISITFLNVAWQPILSSSAAKSIMIEFILMATGRQKL